MNDIPIEMTNGYCMFAVLCCIMFYGIATLFIVKLIYPAIKKIWRILRLHYGSNKMHILPILFMLAFSQSIMADTRVPSVKLNNPELQQHIKEKTEGKSEEEIVRICKSLTLRCLRFSVNSKLNSMEQLSLEHEVPTHCVGYARTFVSFCNYAFKTNHKNAVAYHYRGPLRIMNIDITKVMSRFFMITGQTRWYNFSKDHDYAIIKYHDKEKRIEPLL